MRKLACLLLALVMILSLATVAFAEDATKNDSITIENRKLGETYDLYKIFDLTVNDESAPTAYAYSVNEEWVPFFTTGEGKNYVTIDTVEYKVMEEVDGEVQEVTKTIYYVTAISDAKALAKAALKWEGKPEASISSTDYDKDRTSLTIDGLSNGYWLIGSSVGAIGMAATTPDEAAVTVNEKNPDPTVDKQVMESSESAGQEDKFGTQNDAQIGTEVAFKSIVTIPEGARNLVLHDKMTEGLTFSAGSIEIDGLTKDVDYTVAVNVKHGETDDTVDTFDIIFAQSWLDTLTAETTEVVVQYTAVLNENAAKTVGQNGALADAENTTYLSYGNASESTADKTVTCTYDFWVLKYDGSKYNEDDANKAPLAGAVFSLKLDGNVVPLVPELAEGETVTSVYHVAGLDEIAAGESVSTFTTVANSPVYIKGVDSKTYTLKEVEAPDGYNRLKKEIDVVITNVGPIKIEIANQTGIELPGTGGMGTTLFYVLGGILVLAAVVLLVTKKRMGAAK